MTEASSWAWVGVELGSSCLEAWTTASVASFLKAMNWARGVGKEMAVGMEEAKVESVASVVGSETMWSICAVGWRGRK